MLSTNSLIKIAVEEARKSNNKFRFGAVIYSKNTVLSRNHNYSLKSAKNLHPRFRTWPGSIHAEMSAILSAKCDVSGSTLFVIRINRAEDLMFAMPCAKCLSYIDFVGIKRVTFSTGFSMISSAFEFKTIFLK